LSTPAVRDESNGDRADRLPVPARAPQPRSGTDAWPLTAMRLSRLYADAESRAVAGQRELERLQRRVHELESWLEQNARYDEVEHVQLGRLLALDSAEREQRRLPLLASTRALMLFVYAVAALALAALMLAPQLWP
jgi:hypothetical protein